MKKGNEYKQLIDPKLYENLPKAVIAAIAVSFIVNAGGDANEGIKAEWAALYANGIVPQKPYAN